MPPYCSLCGRSFKAQADLDKHIRMSPAHKRSFKTPPEVRTTEQIIQLPTVRHGIPRVPQPKQQEQRRTSHFALGTHQVKRAEPEQALASSSRTLQAADQGQHAQTSKVIASSPGLHKSTNSAVKAISQDEKSRWTVIPESEHTAVLEALSVHCHSPMELQDNNYVMCLYNPLDYIDSRKCKRCNVEERDPLNLECTFHLKERNKRCPYRPYRCCTTEGRGCTKLPTHDYQLPLRAIKHKEFLPTPAASAHETKFGAVTLDCEMAGVGNGAGEAILLCVADYVTGAVLLNRFISPGEKITQMRSAIHGISKSKLDAAIRQGQALAGWEEARQELWKYIDNNTILIGHALENDLDALRMIHLRVVDSAILSGKAVGTRRIRWGLKTLCSELLKLKIRNNKGEIHNCLEDVLATREVVLFCTRNKEVFQSWAEVKKIKETRLEEKREAKRQKKG